MKKLWLLIVVLVGACDSGGETPGQKSSSSATVITGIAAMGIVSDGTVTAYDFSGCQKGNKLAETKLLNTNQYELTIPPNSSSGPIMLELSNFTYAEESSRIDVNASTNFLYGSFVLNAGVDQNASISYWTNLAHARTTFLCIDASNQPTQNIQSSNDAFSGVLLFDIIKVLPQQLASKSVIFSDLDVIRYGVANSAISYFTYELDHLDGKTGPHNTYTSIVFAESSFDDLSYDNILNGYGSSAELALGVTAILSDTYRTTVPNNIYYALAINDISPNSRKDEIGVVAEFLNSSDALNIFPDVPVIATTKWNGPKILSISPVSCWCDFTEFGNSDCIVQFDLDVESKRIQYTVTGSVGRDSMKIPTIKVLNGNISPTQGGKPRFEVRWSGGAGASTDISFLSQDEIGLSSSAVIRLKTAPSVLTPCDLAGELI